MKLKKGVSKAISQLKKYKKKYKKGEKAIVLVSGGLDSLVTLAYAVHAFGAENVTALDFSYGASHGTVEMKCSDNIAKYFGVERQTIDVSSVFEASSSAMLEKNKDKIIHKSYEEQIYGEDGTEERHTVNTYCPNRNAIFINIAAAIAIIKEAQYVFVGVHKDDAAGSAYADTSVAFVKKERKALAEGTDPKIYLEAPLMYLSKAENVQLGLSLGLSQEVFDMSWSCYDPIKNPDGTFSHCGTCGTCVDRARALEENGLNINFEKKYEV